MEQQNKANKAVRFIKNHLSDSTAMILSYTPMAAAVETFTAGITNEDSANARTFGAGLTYAGLGLVYSKGLHLSRRIYQITTESTEKEKLKHDTLYGIAFSLAISPFFYLAVGINDWKQITIGTVIGTGAAIFGSGITGYSIDGFRDLMGLENSERIPRRIANLRASAKKGLAALLVAGSIGLTAGVYGLRTTVDNCIDNYSSNRNLNKNPVAEQCNQQENQ